ncbi:hypothetical protein NKG94_16720 [Micromonospora sp. M12]
MLQGNGAHPTVKSFTCQECASDLSIDIRTGRVAVAQRLTRLPPRCADPGQPPKPRPRVHCDRCDTTLDADISSVDGGASPWTAAADTCTRSHRTCSPTWWRTVGTLRAPPTDPKDR